MGAVVAQEQRMIAAGLLALGISKNLSRRHGGNLNPDYTDHND